MMGTIGCCQHGILQRAGGLSMRHHAKAGMDNGNPDDGARVERASEHGPAGVAWRGVAWLDLTWFGAAGRWRSGSFQSYFALPCLALASFSSLSRRAMPLPHPWSESSCSPQCTVLRRPRRSLRRPAVT